MAAQPQQSMRQAPAPIPVAGMEGSMFKIENFGSLNTKAKRPAIGDEEFSWLENMMQIGDGNMRSLPTNSTAIYTASGKTIVYDFPFNVGTNQYNAMFFSDGTAVQVNVNTLATTTISAVGGTFYNGGDLPCAAQWGNSGILIVSTASTNGYWAWDGVTLYSAGQAAPTWLSGLLTAVTVVGDTHSNTTVDNIASTTGILTGYNVTGSGIPAGTTVVTVGANSIIISQSATSTAGGITLTFTFAMPTGIQGTSVETYQSRVWIDNIATKYYSAPTNGTSFAGSLGGGSFQSSDSFLRHQFISSKQSNGFLYTFGDSSINVISNVQTAGSPLATTFNNQNVDPQMGTSWRGSVQPFGRGLIFANPSGVYALYGGSAEKVSGQLDGLFAQADFTTLTPSAAVATIYGIRVYLLLIRATDYLGTPRNFLCIWDGKKWFLGSQDLTLTFIQTQEFNSVLTAWGTDGTRLFQLCGTTSNSLTKVIQTKLWSGQAYVIVKQILRIFELMQDNSGSGVTLSGTLDYTSENGSSTIPVTLASLTQAIIWLNNSSAVVTWLNNNSQSVVFTVTGLTVAGKDLQASANLCGLTLTSTSPDFTLISLALLYRQQAPTGG